MNLNNSVPEGLKEGPKFNLQQPPLYFLLAVYTQKEIWLQAIGVQPRVTWEEWPLDTPRSQSLLREVRVRNKVETVRGFYLLACSCSCSFNHLKGTWKDYNLHCVIFKKQKKKNWGNGVGVCHSHKHPNQCQLWGKYKYLLIAQWWANCTLSAACGVENIDPGICMQLGWANK